MDDSRDDDLEDDSSRPLLADEAASDPSFRPNFPHKISRSQFYAALPALVLGILLYAADNILELAAFPRIGSELHQLRHVAWLSITYGVSVAAVQPLYSRLSDIYGRKTLLLASYMFFTVGIILCAISYNFWMLVIARLVVGAGAAGLGYMVSLIFNDIISLQDRSSWQSALQFFVFTGQLIGGTMGGLVVDRIGWRWAFALELPVAILGFVFVFITVQLPPLPSQRIQIDQPGDSIVRPQQKLSFDIYGAMALASFVATLVLALSMGGNDVPWSHPAIPTLLVLSGLSFVFFLIIERRTLDTPLVPLYLVVRRSIWPLFVITFFKDMAFMTLLYLTSLYSNLTGHRTTTVGGLLVTTIAIGTAAGNLVAGLYIRRFGRLKDLLIGSMVMLLAAAIAIRLRWNGSEPVVEAGSEILVCGICNGIIIGTLLVGLLKSVDSTDKAAAYGALHLCTAVANLVALSVITAITQSRSRLYMAEALRDRNAENIPEIITACVESLQCLEALPPYIQVAVRESYVKGISDGFTFICVNVLVSFLFSLVTSNYKINAEE
ncbi:hypothetical protein HO133_008639 [Letharia lupina]|uniref:Major facilitator superfamily (MFS) profile domain-containing protein n=1 Tax=Letharia lupina TaxID=560253 RepID=A0A8H6FG20_9LECA|nr:uncharacterized protein HO133_008639 [Letharia lupina]KAF6227197.1 hypothetical protein HO133_008639 [Letharia lupina]